MNLDIDGRRAIVTGSTSGLGLACARALAAEGVHVTICGRDRERLAQALDSLSSYDVVGVSADLTDFAGREQLWAVEPAPDILVNNLSGPPPKQFLDTTVSDWMSVFNSHLLTPIEMIRSALPGMRERTFGRIINITSAMVLTPRPHHVLSTSARAGLTAAVKAISIEAAVDNVTINNLLPERVDTPRQEQMARAAMMRDNLTYDQARAAQVRSIAAGRLGRPEDFGALCAFLCSDSASYISGQNIRFDGASAPMAF